ncbi:MAG TPA: translocation/assembly module TamB domain-containing protein, partial [Oxalicibacterium sp.]|nr:translocation/assembly module TamB domain-containing protein [Oxalicibacterium sp.]
GRVALMLRAEGKQLGRIALDLSTVLGNGNAPFALAPNAALSGSAQVNTPALGWLGPLVSQALVTEGSLQANVNIGGSVGDPHLSGQIAADQLRLMFSDSGIDLKQGTLRGEFQNDRLLIKTLSFQNDGTLAITGPISLVKQQLALELSIKATRYRLLDRSDRKLVISGDSVVGWREGELKARGNFSVDSGFVDIGTADAPELSDDVVIVGRSAKPGTKTAIALDLGLDLGKGIRLRGRGLDALLLGQIRLLASAGESLRAEGTLRVKSGTFKAYGRELAIERGLLRFNGALNNPTLDILAMRKDQEVEAGVSVGGTVLAPRITLVSDPTVPDAEKLSWLVLGHGLSNASGGDASALQAAAGSLLAHGAASGLSAQLATAFGLDDFSVGTSDDTLQERIVTLGKKISSRLYVSYQQGLESASSVLLLRYTLTRRVSLEAEAGTRSALSLFYNFAFD